MTGEGWRQLVESRRWLRRYSLRNILMILMQCPGASDVRPLSEWNKLGCYTRKGTKQIKIWAPSTRTIQTTEVDPETGELKTLRAVRFVLVNVVDVSQLANPPAREDISPSELHGAAPEGLWDSITRMVEAEGFTVERGDCGTALGWVDFPGRTVRVRAGVDPAQAVKTLAHELAHILCEHNTRDLPPAVREVEAESVACVVTSVLGLDSLAYSVPYVAGWAGDRDAARGSAEQVLAVADRILAGIGAPAPGATGERA
ncbi:MAG: hypothetical protein IRZ28_20805 [Steroidobacteraceae bacterium]|nr:hypothetical protein [Steroidobacteraceae bacterium]